MKDQKTQQSETSAVQAKKRNDRKRLLMARLSLVVIATACIGIWLIASFCSSSSRPSTPSEIEMQKDLQVKLLKAQNEYQQIFIAATIESEPKLDSSGK